jgi:hypothetical protein
MTFGDARLLLAVFALGLVTACQDLTPVPPPDTGPDDDATTDDGGGDETVDDSSSEAADDSGDAGTE